MNLFKYTILAVGTLLPALGYSADGLGEKCAMSGTTYISPVVPGTVSPSNLVINSGTSPGLLTCTPATGGSCSAGTYGYQWQSSTNSISWGNVSGQTTLTYNPGNLSSTEYYRVRVICSTDTEYSASVEIQVATVNANLSYIRTRTLSKPGVTDTVTADGLTSPWDVQQSTTYFDGLGRPVQTVAKQASPLQNDMVTVEVYDALGRSAINYLPYTSTSTTGTYKTDPIGEQSAFNSAQFPSDQFFYGQTLYEPSPLDRTVLSSAAGNSWVGSSRGVGQQYSVNAVSDSVQNWTIASAAESLPVSSGLFAAGTLYKNITTDEAGHQVVQYTDQEGHMLLKKMQLSGTPSSGPTGWLNTYYVYDSLSNLRFIAPPAAVQWLMANGWNFSASGGTTVASAFCFRYEYDFRKRMYIKKIPGTGEVWSVYDGRDRLVMTQDSMRRSAKQWLVTRYDVENRPDSTGLITDASNYNNLSYHTNAALNSSNYPVVASYPYTPLTMTHYEDYAWVTALGGSMTATMDTSFNSNSSYFVTSYNAGPVYAVDQTPLMITRGLVTGTTRYLLTSGSPQYDVNFYDDRGRTIEVQSTNYTNGLDKDINQYDFSGKTLRHLLVTKKNGTNPQGHIFCHEFGYDAAFRMTGIKKDFIDGPLVTIDTLEFDESGRLRANYLGGGIDSLVYSYNIRGWRTGINKNFVAGTATDYFGMELAYDQQTSVSTTTYAATQYAGNITGLIWKSAGDGINRKYDFTYDTLNRLTGASFLQNPSGSTWNTAAMDYSVSALSYDANGNILGMNQKGFKVGTPSGLIDQLSYAYQTNSNQLSQVTDLANDTASTLGDFHYKTKGSYDYTYDGNGNLKIDNNKGIDSIAYNYLNLPQYIHIKGKGTITFAYDATGQKEAKIVVDSTSGPVKTTTSLYIKNFQYTNDSLTLASFEEGRARWQKRYLLSGDSVLNYVFDYFLKDHLGNTRVILTTEKDTAQYMATMEAAYRAKELKLFYNVDSTCYPKSSVPGGYPTDNTTVPNDSVAMVEGNTGSHTQGPAIILKVMTGDSISIGVKSYYLSGSAGSTTSSLNSVLNTLAQGLVSLGGGGGHGTIGNLDNTSGSPIYAALNSFMPTYDTTPGSKPKAYLNWMLLDNQFNYVSGNNQSGAISVGSANALNTLATTIKLKHSGYLYIWVSNETQNWMVFFDNLSVQDFAGPMLEETHYYPFGLTMAGISDKALKSNYAENKYRFNKGSELENKEFSDGSGLEMYETSLRELDPQLGRWWQIDPKSGYSINSEDQQSDNTEDESEVGGLESVSPYASMGNDPIKHNDPKGDVPCCETAAAVWQATQVAVENSDPEIVGPLIELGGTIASAVALAYDGATYAQGQANRSVPTADKITLVLPKDTEKPIVQAKAKKGPKDLVKEAKDQKAKEVAAAARAANRAAQTAQGKAKTGNSNQKTKGDHNTNKSKSNKNKHDKAQARRAREQKAAEDNNNNQQQQQNQQQQNQQQQNQQQQ